MTDTDGAADIGAAMARLLLEAGAIQVSHDRPFVLAAGFVIDSAGDLGINFVQRTRHGRIFHIWKPSGNLS